MSKTLKIDFIQGLSCIISSWPVGTRFWPLNPRRSPVGSSGFFYIWLFWKLCWEFYCVSSLSWIFQNQRYELGLPSETKQFYRLCHQIIWAQWKINKGWVGIPWYKKSNVWITAIRTTSTKISRISIIKIRICTKKTYPRIMETQMAADMFHPGSRQIWSKIPRQIKFLPHHKCTQRTLWDSGRLGRKNTLDSHLIGIIKDEYSTSPCWGT